MNITATKSLIAGMMLCGVMAASTPMAFAANEDPPHWGHMSLRSVGAGLLSFFIWPGIGQAVNNNKGDKVLTHAILGITQIWRIPSGLDALLDRQGGYWHGRI